MTDVLELAKERRELLAAEVAKLDNFLRIAIALAESGGGEDMEDAADLGLGRSVEQDDELILTDLLSKDTTALDAHVGKMIRYRRWMMAMTHEQLSETVGIGPDVIQDYEAGLRHVGTDVLRDIAMAMDVPVSFFVKDFDDPDGEDPEFLDHLLPES